MSTTSSPPDNDSDAADRKARRWWLLLVLAALVLLLAYVYWPGPSASAKGRVKVLNGPAAVKVTITVHGADGPVVKAAKVGPNGDFTFGGLPPGPFQLSVERQAPANRAARPANMKHVRTTVPGPIQFDQIGALNDGSNELGEIVIKD